MASLLSKKPKQFATQKESILIWNVNRLRISVSKMQRAYVVGAAIAIKKNCIHAADAAEAIGEGLQAFCIPGSVADDRKVGLGHGNLAARLLREETQCFAFLAGPRILRGC